jgi:hypothetical protein
MSHFEKGIRDIGRTTRLKKLIVLIPQGES